MCIRDRPQDFFELQAAVLDTAGFELPRITEAPFDDADGNFIRLSKDLLGNDRKDQGVPGPLANLKAGKNRIRIW